MANSNRATTSTLNTAYTAICGQVVDAVMLQTIYDASLHAWERGDHVFSHGHLNLFQIDTTDETRGFSSNNHPYWDFLYYFENGGYNKATIYWKCRLDSANSTDNGSLIYTKYFGYPTNSIDFDSDGVILSDTLVGAGNGLCYQSDSSRWTTSDFPEVEFLTAAQAREGCMTFDIPNPPTTSEAVSNAIGFRLGRSSGSTPQSGDQYEYGVFYFSIKLWGGV